jgi:hypothetical protein
MLSVHHCTALGFSVFTSRILATDLSRSHCDFKSRMKSSWHHLIPFLLFLQLSIPRLPSTTVVYFTVLCLLLLLLSWPTLITTLHGLCTENRCHVNAIQPVQWRAGCCLVMISAWTYRKHVT